MLLISLLFGWYDLGRLASADYRVREAATARLVRLWPLSAAALDAGHDSPDPEVRHRSQVALRTATAPFRVALMPGVSRHPWLLKVQANLVRPDMVAFAAADKSGKRMLALWLILCPFDDAAGLPWVPAKIHAEYHADRELAAALCDLVNHSFAPPPGEPDIMLACDPRLKTNPMPKHLGGLDNVRFWARGLPDPGYYGSWAAHGRLDEVRALWAKAKRPGLVPPAPPK